MIISRKQWHSTMDNNTSEAGRTRQIELVDETTDNVVYLIATN